MRTKQTDRKEKIGNLRKAAALAPGLSVPDAELKLNEARREHRTAEREVERVQESIEHAGLRLEELRAGRGGPAGPALSALDAEQIAA
ncbi:hypothetical protein, partial [Salinispora arenicola]|uniref:hypothetical protein n=1 Tax=Salinispora arenicola TaxID=168697 RepID=UPI0027DD31A1